jgi:hypothetical protein
MKGRLRAVGAFLVLAGLAACTPQGAPPESGSTPSVEPAAAASPSPSAGANASSQTAEPTGAQAPAVVPTARTLPEPQGPGGQYATDPSTVVLAAGKPTLVKFFAFW